MDGINLDGMFTGLIVIGGVIVAFIISIIWLVVWVASSDEIELKEPCIQPIRMEIITENGVRDTLYIYKKF